MKKTINKSIYERNLLEERTFLDKDKARAWIDGMFNWMFSIQKEYIGYAYFAQKEKKLKKGLKELMREEEIPSQKIKFVSEDFFNTISIIHKQLYEDLSVFAEFDPAAKSRHEVIVSYPGFYAISVYRIAHYLWKKEIFVLSRLIAEIAHSKTGVDIHPGAEIGRRFFIDHGTGIVVGETTKIGDEVKIYQGVTLGALSVSKGEALKKRHPTIKDKVIIYANATILGGDTIIGEEAIIGGNVWITSSIPPKSLVYHKGQMVVKDKPDFPDTTDYTI